MRWSALLLTGLLAPALTAHAYPGGTPHYITDLVPACASCHSVVDAGTMPELPPERAGAEQLEKKHLGAIRAGAFPLYSELTDKLKEQLLAEVRGFDSDSEVRVETDREVSAGTALEVRVRYAGGNGPVVGVMLVDRPLRYQARPTQSAGWQILGVTAKTGDGENASAWFNARHGSKDADLNYVLLPAEWALGRDIPSGVVTYRLRAPADPGEYPLTAVLLYGTENSTRAAFFQRPSGRILFSSQHNVRVK